MDTLRMVLNSRKRLESSAAMAALLVFVAGGANALAGTNSVRCVPTLSVDRSCAVAYATISGAVAASASGDVIVVGPGYYNVSVHVGVPTLSPSSVQKLEWMRG